MMIVDPPGGWKYGFPKLYVGTLQQMLKDSGYPEKDIKFALENSRYWEEPTPETKDI